MRSALRLSAVCLVLGLSVVHAASCGSDESAPANTFTTTGSAGGGTGSGGAGGGIGPVTCDPACLAPQFCSVTNVCIDAGTCLGDGDCGEGLECDLATKSCVPGGMCGGAEATLEAIPPNLLVVLDRSCSMDEDAGSGATKWEIAVAAINQLTTSFDGDIRFGLTLFPDKVTPDCKQDLIPIPVDPAAGPAIQTLLTAALDNTDALFPKGPCVTNIDTAMEQAASEPAFLDMDRQSFALLITDGKQSSGCSAGGGDAGTLQTITDLAAAKVPTFVVGFGAGVDVNQMNEFADAGGMPSGDPTNHFYLADDQASLDAALLAIATATLSCTFTLGEIPPDPSQIYVFFDNDPAGIAADPSHMQGWDYDAATNQVTFYGATCDAIKAGTVSDVDIVFGCDEPSPT
jgi:hypothetical protein